ncbi:MAG TPA: GNAT family N-acetyltransferase [Hyphomicrobium sp.]|jgi:ribosomal protein S18 acetylase RimI-like enzyme
MLSASSQCEVRRGNLSDAPALSEIYRLTWSQAYLGIIPHLHLDNMIKRRGADWWRSTIKSGNGVLVLQVSGIVAGYATLGAARARGMQEGEIYELYITPTHQGLGFGELLFEACRNQLDTRQLSGLIVWALADNDRAAEFYWRRGGRPVGSGFERFGDKRLKKIAFAWD